MKMKMLRRAMRRWDGEDLADDGCFACLYRYHTGCAIYGMKI